MLATQFGIIKQKTGGSQQIWIRNQISNRWMNGEKDVCAVEL